MSQYLHPHFEGRPILVGDLIQVVNLEDANTSYPYDEVVKEITLDYAFTDEGARQVYYGVIGTQSGFEVYETEKLAEKYGHGSEMAGYVSAHTPQKGKS